LSCPYAAPQARAHFPKNRIRRQHTSPAAAKQGFEGYFGGFCRPVSFAYPTCATPLWPWAA